MTLADDPGFVALARRLEALGLPALDMYKEKCLRRRLAVRMRASGAATLADYAARIAADPAEAERLRDALTINVTDFFRNPESWARLGTALPALLRARRGSLHIWSAGCATGEEAWSAAILAASLLSEAGLPITGARLRVDATDVDPRCLTVARTAAYPEAAFAAMPAPLQSRWTEPVAGGRSPVALLHPLVRVLPHDMGREDPPHPPYDLIVCRNVLIYFARPAYEAILDRFAGALRPGGLLLLGKVESLIGAARERFEPVDIRERLFRRRDD
jgi:chemotaxis protein methyltransferase CheR